MEVARWLRPLALVGLGALAAACGKPAPLPATPFETYTFREVRGGVRLAAEPYFVPARTGQLFPGGDDFAEQGLLPIRILVDNRSDAEIRIDPRDARLLDARGQQASALHPDDAFALVKLQVGWWALGAGYIGGSAQAYRNDSRKKAIDERALREQRVPPGATATGFLYFQIAGTETKLDGLRVRLPLTEPTGRQLPFDLALRGGRDGSGVASPSSPAAAAGTTEKPASRGIIIRSPAP